MKYYCISTYDLENKISGVKQINTETKKEIFIYVNNDWQKVTFVLSFYHCLSMLIGELKGVFNRFKYIVKSLFKLVFYLLFKNDLLKGK